MRLPPTPRHLFNTPAARLAWALLLAAWLALLGLSPVAIPTASAQEGGEITLSYTLDRAGVPRLNYNEITLEIWIGTAASVEAAADGERVEVQYDPESGYAVLTTAADALTLTVRGARDDPRLGEAAPAALKYDRAWAWSHSFDDNTTFKEYGIPAFDQYGWRATVYVIGSKLDPARDEDWIIDIPDLVRLAQKGWVIGNHTWTHTSVENMGGADAALRDIQKLDETLAQVYAQAGLPDTRRASFAAPAFDAAYLPLIKELRGAGSDLLFDESGSAGILRVDGAAARGAAPEPKDSPFPAFDPEAQLGRDIRIDYFGTGDEREQAFRADIAAMTARLDDSHHYWLNTFTHGVDKSYPGGSIFAFLPWLYENYGPGGDDSVWVAPAEEIYSYLLVRDDIRISGPQISGDALVSTTPTIAPRTGVPPAPTPTAPAPSGPANFLDWLARLFAGLFPAR